MATQTEIETGYDTIDAIHRAAFGEHADVSCAFYDGDFTLTLEEAQRRKHGLILDGLGLEAGDTLLDIGCGWGPLLEAARGRGIEGTGITLSPAQVARCRKAGLDARLQDWRDLDPSEPGHYDGVASVGAFEHFATPADSLDGRQVAIYRDFFRLCRAMLPDGGRLFLQTMTWGARVPRPTELDIHSPKLSDPWVMGHLSYLYPGSWLPEGKDQIVECAAPWFDVTFCNEGRQDYLHTMHDWGRALAALGLRKWIFVSPLLVKSSVDPSARRLLIALRYGCSRLCFERGLFSHYRMILASR